MLREALLGRGRERTGAPGHEWLRLVAADEVGHRGGAGGGEIAPQVAHLFEGGAQNRRGVRAMGEAAGEQRRGARWGGRAGGVSLCEIDTFPYQTVDIRAEQVGLPAGAEGDAAPSVGGDDDQVGGTLRGPHGRRKSGNEGAAGDGSHWVRFDYTAPREGAGPGFNFTN